VAAQQGGIEIHLAWIESAVMFKSAKPRSTTIKHVIILCHPDADSFNAHVARTYCETVESLGQVAVLRDLYRLPFDPVLKSDERPTSPEYCLNEDVRVELDILQDADVVVLVYPIWFGTPPAMLKGYVDRVFGANFHYHAIRDRSDGAPLRNKHLLSITTSGNSKQWLEGQGAWLSLLHVFDHYIAHAFSMTSTDHLHLGNISTPLAERFVKEELYRVKEKARETAARFVTGDAPIKVVSA
jgi:NAD(P)H dehydrogenase (quinone)